MTEKIELPMLNDGSVDQLQMIDVIKRFIILQDKFNQLTSHVENCYKSIDGLRKIITNKVLS